MKNRNIARPRYHDKPCAASGLISYRYKTQFECVMIGANNHEDAFREAGRSVEGWIKRDYLSVWDGKKYVPFEWRQDTMKICDMPVGAYPSFFLPR